jgi:hypothetical protein
MPGIKVRHLLAAGRWFSMDTTISSTNKTGRYDITEILLKVALKHNNPNLKHIRRDTLQWEINVIQSISLTPIPFLRCRKV